MSTTMLPLPLRVPPETHAKVTELRRRKPEIPPMSAVVRELIELGLQVALRREQKNHP